MNQSEPLQNQALNHRWRCLSAGEDSSSPLRAITNDGVVCVFRSLLSVPCRQAKGNGSRATASSRQEIAESQATVVAAEMPKQDNCVSSRERADSPRGC